jgi:hypothetical protein
VRCERQIGRARQRSLDVGTTDFENIGRLASSGQRADGGVPGYVSRSAAVIGHMPFQRQSRVLGSDACLVHLLAQSFVLVSCRDTHPVIQKGQSGGQGGRGSTIRIEELSLVKTESIDGFKRGARLRFVVFTLPRPICSSAWGAGSEPGRVRR